MVSGCISQTYYQKVNIDGTSVIEQTTDYSGMISRAGEREINSGIALQTAKNTFDSICQKTNMGCNYTETAITLSTKIDQKNPYYNFEVEYGFLGANYKMTINKIPRQQFEATLQKDQSELKEIGLNLTNQIVPDIDLSNKKENALLANEIINNDGNARYTIEFPIDIKSATAGNYSPKIEGRTVEFDITTVLSNSAPIVIEGEEFNLAMPIAIILIGSLGYVWFKFSRMKKNISVPATAKRTK